MTGRPDYKRVMAAVRRLREKYGLDEPPVNPVEIARQEGIDVKFVNFTGDYERVAGFYDPTDNTIYVNKVEYPKRQTFTIAHELGHALLHKDWASSENYAVLWRDPERNHPDDPREKEANAFAAHLLVPADLLDTYYYELGLKVPELSRLFVVSVPVIKNRLAFEYGIDV